MLRRIDKEVVCCTAALPVLQCIDGLSHRDGPYLVTYRYFLAYCVAMHQCIDS